VSQGGHLNTIFSHLHDKHGITRHGTSKEFLQYISAFNKPKCACGCGLEVELHNRKLEYNLFSKKCANSSRYRNPSCPEFHLFKGKNVQETINAIRLMQGKKQSDDKIKLLSDCNSGINNPMSLHSIVERTGLSEEVVRQRLSNNSAAPRNGFYKRKHSKESLIKIAESRARQFKTVTNPEMAIWGMLTALEIEFKYQVPVDKYVVDFLIASDVVIEVFGDYWHNKNMKSSGRKTSDESKINELNNLGYNVIVIWESEIFNSPVIVLDKLKSLVYYENQKNNTNI